MAVLIVGNSKGLIGSEKGKFIDSYDIVVRLNGGIPTKQNGTDIGGKTTYWSFSANQTQFRKWFDKWDVCPEILVLNFRGRTEASHWIDNSDLPHRKSSPEIYNSLVTEFGHPRPSTGLITIHYLVKHENQKDVSVIGFDGFKTPTWYRGGSAHGPHKGDQEMAYLKSIGVQVL